MLDMIIHQQGRERYNEMLRDAELERRAYRARRANQERNGTVTSRLLLQISHWLIDSGSWLKQRSEMNPGLS